LSLSDKQIRIYRVDVEHYFCAGSTLVHNGKKTGATFLKELDLKHSSRNIKTNDTFGLKIEIIIVVDKTLFTFNTSTQAVKLLRKNYFLLTRLYNNVWENRTHLIWQPYKEHKRTMSTKFTGLNAKVGGP
jgi:hypothetical protein